jgi:predicted dehydrogenase
MQIARRRPQGGPPEVQETDFTLGKMQGLQDDVWAQEWAAFISCVLDRNVTGNGNTPSACGVDAWEALKIVDAAYEASRSGTVVMLRGHQLVCNASSSSK